MAFPIIWYNTTTMVIRFHKKISGLTLVFSMLALMIAPLCSCAVPLFAGCTCCAQTQTRQSSCCTTEKPGQAVDASHQCPCSIGEAEEKQEPTRFATPEVPGVVTPSPDFSQQVVLTGSPISKDQPAALVSTRGPPTLRAPPSSIQ